MHVQSNPHTIFDPRQILDQHICTLNLGPTRNSRPTSTHVKITDPSENFINPREPLDPSNYLTHATHESAQFSRLQIHYPEDFLNFIFTKNLSNCPFNIIQKTTNRKIIT